MKKLLTILVSAIMSVSLFGFVALAGTTTTPSAVKVKVQDNSKQVNNLNKELAKLQAASANIEVQIQKAIKNTTNKQNKTNEYVGQKQDASKDLQAKWQDNIKNIAAHDEIEQDKLAKDIQYWTNQKAKEIDYINKNIANIDSNLAKQIAKIDAKIVNVKDDATKQKYIQAKDSLTKYALLKKDAFSTFLGSRQKLWDERTKIWEARKAMLNERQDMDNKLHNALINVLKMELSDSLANLPGIQVVNISNIEKVVRAKFQTRVDAIEKRINAISAKITKLSSK